MNQPLAYVHPGAKIAKNVVNTAFDSFEHTNFRMSVLGC